MGLPAGASGFPGLAVFWGGVPAGCVWLWGSVYVETGRVGVGFVGEAAVPVLLLTIAAPLPPLRPLPCRS